MKLSLIASVSAFTTENRVSRDVEEKGVKRYSQLEDMMLHYNADFDERKYWSYGCHCLMLGDRPMSEMGRGKPIDRLDSACKAWKDCQRCARETFGPDCIGEFTKYKYGYKNQEVVCKNKPNTCDRALCECDALFAKVHVAAKDVWSSDYHSFYSTTNPAWEGPDNTDQCASNPGAPDMQCCTNTDITSPFIWFNANNKKCCPDGTVIGHGDMC